MFYPNQKPHISPSALSYWHDNRGMFIRSYFLGEKSPETSAMKTGKMVHTLIEAGILTVNLKYDLDEMELTSTVEVDAIPVTVLGRPDSFKEKGKIEFVDYKTGKENNWDDKELANDLKMKTTAWLVWKATGEPKEVVGYIEYIPTQWNPSTREIEPIGGSQVVATRVYPSKELEDYTEFIIKTIRDINQSYEEWLKSTDEYIDQSALAEYAELDTQKKELENRMSVIKDKISEGMSKGNKATIATPFGTFYFTSRKSYVYPGDLKIDYLDSGLVLEDVEAIETATSIAKKKFEQENEPNKISQTLAFKPKK